MPFDGIVRAPIIDHLTLSYSHSRVSAATVAMATNGIVLKIMAV